MTIETEQEADIREMLNGLEMFWSLMERIGPDKFKDEINAILRILMKYKRVGTPEKP